ncbi:MAG: hypothetical protein OSB05_15110 [Akkermansiaceae bacterium]|nr:hypothetical protein [Akkermansiaceae bacterium]
MTKTASCVSSVSLLATCGPTATLQKNHNAGRIDSVAPVSLALLLTPTRQQF